MTYKDLSPELTSKEHNDNIHTISTNPFLKPSEKLVLIFLNTTGYENIKTDTYEVAIKIGGISFKTVEYVLRNLEKLGYLERKVLRGDGVVLSNYGV